MARTNVLTTARRIRRQLGSIHRQEELVLASAVNDTATTFTFLGSMPLGVQAGVMLGIDFELCRVLTVNTTANSVTVLRGHHDSVAAAHDANVLVELNPRFSLLDVYEAMLSEIETWSPELYRVASSLITVATDEVIVELPAGAAGALRVLDARQSEETGDYTVWPRIGVREIRTDAATFTQATASGIFLRLLEPIRTGSLYVQYTLPFDSTLLTATADLVTDCYLTSSMIDLLELGTRRRALLIDESGRSARQAQDEARRNEETPAGSTLAFHQLQQALYTRRRTEEINRLRSLYPLRMN